MIIIFIIIIIAIIIIMMTWYFLYNADIQSCCFIQKVIHFNCKGPERV